MAEFPDRSQARFGWQRQIAFVAATRKLTEPATECRPHPFSHILWELSPCKGNRLGLFGILYCVRGIVWQLDETNDAGCTRHTR